MPSIKEQIAAFGIVPVIKIDALENAVPLAKALCDGGLPVAEITFRTDCAAQAIAKIRKELPDMLVGAGTVLTCQQADFAIAAGAQFIVSPGLNPNVVRHCIEKGIPIMPGCSSPSDVEAAMELGLDTVKFFPAEAAGGLAMIRAMSAPYAGVKFMPTGGINETNLLSYLKFDKILACGGSFMVKDSLIKEKQFSEIKRLTEQAVHLMLGFELRHLGINCADDADAKSAAGLFSAMFGFPVNATGKSYFSSDAFEMMCGCGRGTKGHIAIGTHFVDRAVAYLTRKGYAFDASSAVYDEAGKLKLIYFAEEFFGFGVHLVRK